MNCVNKDIPEGNCTGKKRTQKMYAT